MSFLLLESVQRQKIGKNISKQHASKQVLTPVEAITFGYVQQLKHNGQHKHIRQSPVFLVQLVIGLSQSLTNNLA